MSTPMSFKDYVKYVDDEESTKTKKKLNKKSYKGRYYGGAMESIGSAALPCVFSSNVVNSTQMVAKPEDEEDMEMDDFDDELDNDMDDEFDDSETEEPEDPNKQGTIRVVKGAHLVYKRKDEGGNFEELWIYNIEDGKKDDLEVRRDILAGTDIPTNKKKSEDGSQRFTLWTVGNVQFLNITGLPN